MFLLFYDNVASECELMKIATERLDYLWFLGYELDAVVPHHSVLSKARRRRLWRVQIQDCLIAGIQNIRILLKPRRPLAQTNAQAQRSARSGENRLLVARHCWESLHCGSGRSHQPINVTFSEN